MKRTHPFAPIDVRFDEHPKYADLSAGHMGLLACGITYATRNLSDGIVPKSYPHRRFGAQGSQLARSLVALGLWRLRADGDYEIVGFLDHNPSRSEVEARIEEKREAGRKGGQASAEARRQAPASSTSLASAEPKSLHFTSIQNKRPSQDLTVIGPTTGIRPLAVSELNDEDRERRRREQLAAAAQWETEQAKAGAK